MTARTCTGCGRPMRRRYGPDLDGTVIHQAKGKCSACYQADKPGRSRPRLDLAELEQRRRANAAATNAKRRARLAGLTTPEPVDPGWQDRAACLTVGPYIFEDPGYTHAARTICDTCPVARSCVEAAMTEEAGQPAAYRAGVRGGLTPTERRSLDRLRRKEVA